MIRKKRMTEREQKIADAIITVGVLGLILFAAVMIIRGAVMLG